MRLGRWQARTEDFEEELAERIWEDELPPEEDEEDGTQAVGWRTRAMAVGGASVLTRWGLWAWFCSGPLLGGLALLGSVAPSGVAAQPVQTVKATPASGIGPAGWAQLYVRAYVDAGTGTEATLAPYYSGTVSLTDAPGSRSAASTVVVGSAQVQAGYWSVTVAADVVARSGGQSTDTGQHFYQVGVQALGPLSAGGTGGGSSGYAATALPAEIAAPAAVQAGSLAYGSSGLSSSDPVYQTAAGFLNAYLAGAGEIAPYTSPGVQIPPISPAPYARLQIDSVTSDDTTGIGSAAVPADGTRRQVLVQVTATNGAGDWPLAYALTLRARAGRWEVAALDPAPRLAAGSPAAPSLTATSAAPPSPSSTPVAVSTATTP